MGNKISRWFNKPMKHIWFYYMSIVAVTLCYILGTMLVHLYDTDTYFLIETGREIIKNGIIHTNPWSCVPDMEFICQQWLYCVIAAWLQDTFHGLGMFLLILTQVALYVVLAFRFLKRRGVSIGHSAIIVGVLLIMGQAYAISTRPETITIVVFLLLALSLEHYIDSGKWYWLLAIPVLNVLEINLHASMWSFHYAIILAYLVPTFYMPKQAKKAPKFKRLPMIIASIVGLPALLLNPYGWDGVMYVFTTYKMHIFRWVQIRELNPPEIMSGIGVCAIMVFVVLVFTLILKSARNASINMVLGFGLLMLLATRNNMFFLFAGLYCFGDLFSVEKLKSLDINWRKDLTNAVFILLVAVDIFFFGMFYSRLAYLDQAKYGHLENSVAYARNMNTIINYLDEYAEPDAKIFTGFDTGAYLQYYGYKNLFIDARPECYGPLMTGGEHLIAEYSAYAQWGIYQVQDDDEFVGSEKYFVTEEDMEAWLDKYNFDYIIVFAGTDCYMQGYLQGSDRYVRAPGSENIVSQPWLIYERADRVD